MKKSYKSYSGRKYGSAYKSRRGYSGEYGRNKSKKKSVIVLSVLLVAAAGAFGACYGLGLFGGRSQDNKSVAEPEKTSQAPEPAPSEPEESSGTQEKKDLKGSFDGNVFIYDKQGYEIFYGSRETAADYAKTVSGLKKSLGDGVNVYSMVVPTHGLYGLPEKYKKQGSDEKSAIKKIYDSMGKDVKTIDVIDAFEKHKNEYIYFRTDTNWTALGAYYAYREFCSAADVKPVETDDLEKGKIDNFRGSLYYSTVTDENEKGNQILKNNPDTVNYYKLGAGCKCTLLERGDDKEKEMPMLATMAQGQYAYSVFIWGDNPYMNIKTGLNTGRKLCIIKDSLGCAFAPFTSLNFDEIFVIDPRYYQGNIKDYIKKNNYTDVLILESVMTANTGIRTDELKDITK